MKAELELHSREDGVNEAQTVEGDTLDSIRDAAAEATEEWMRVGEWGEDGARVSAKWTIKSLTELGEDDDLSGDLTGEVEVEIEPNHEAKIKEAARYEEICGTDPDDHDWTSDGEGGCRENPGVYGHGGTAMSFHSHCRRCGLHRIAHSTGSQRNPGECDTVEYRMLDGDEIAAHRENGDMEKEKASAENE